MRHVGVAHCSVAGNTVSSDHGNNRRLGAGVVGIGHGEEQACGCIVTGVAGVMNLVVAGTQRNAGWRPGRGRMADCAFR